MDTYRKCKQCPEFYASGTYGTHRRGHPEPPESLGRGSQALTERNAEIVAAIEAGDRGIDVALRLGISRERVRQIFTRATGRGIPDIGRLCGYCGERYPVRGGKAHTATHAGIKVSRRVRRFWSKVEKTETCWLWRGLVFPAGYGHVSRFGAAREQYAHRVAYELVVGPIPKGLTIDHLCRVRNCVNPAHLEAVTQRENVLRSPIAPAAINARKTHCKHGHPFSPENTRRSGTGRACRACAAASMRETTRRRRAARLAAAA